MMPVGASAGRARALMAPATELQDLPDALLAEIGLLAFNGWERCANYSLAHEYIGT